MLKSSRAAARRIALAMQADAVKDQFREKTNHRMGVDNSAERREGSMGSDASRNGSYRQPSRSLPGGRDC